MCIHYRVPVNDTRFDWLVEHYKPASKVPAFLNVTDIAGLVKGNVDCSISLYL